MANTAVAKGNTSAENDRSSSNFDMDPYADESILEIGKTVPITHADLASLEDVSRDLRKDPEARAAFLATFTADEEKAIMNKVDRRFFVLIGIMFMVKNIDFGNISIIKTMQAGSDSNIITELNMTPDDYNWVATIQGIPYIIFELPSNLLLKYMTPHAWESRIFLTWGIVTACCGAVNTKSQILALRFLVGMFEAGMFPGVITTLSYWYRTDEVGRPLLWYFAISNLSNIVGSLVCYGASFMNGMQNLSGWRWAFILEGVATVLFAGVIFWVLPDFPKSPRSNSWLTPREQQFLEARLPSSAPATADKSWDTREAWIAFKAPTTWAFLLDQTLMNLATYALSWYLPTIIASLGFAKLPNSLLLNIPPAAAGILAMLICVLITSRAWAPRPLMCICTVLGTIVCFILFFSVSGKAGLYAACILSQFFSSSYYVPYWSWRTSIMAGSTGASFAIGLQSSVAQLGAAIGPQFFQSKWAHNRYRNSFFIGFGITLAALLTNTWTWWLTKRIERRVVEIRRDTLRARREGRAYEGRIDIDVEEDKKIKSQSWF
ncbi:MFS transporter prlL [Colletotrichum siamense]|uniref:MFS transporter prlL n=1 Tax=Colletotrichum siamense TaxID=690259 RepID=A0A9P5ERT9_COLSI|nr:MFS transporter prlL [Colletotrichum siamense]KAF4858460.1 MFS transporter prlL [Colletotrichum siamense]